MKFKIISIFMAAFCFARMSFAADIYLGLSAQGQRSDLAVAGFVPVTPTLEEASVSRQTETVLRNDLLMSRYFNIVEEGPSYSGKPDEVKNWHILGVQVIVAGKVEIRLKDMILTAQLLDTGSGQAVWERIYRAKFSDFRRVAHEVNDDILFRLTGERGIAHTRIAFTNSASGNKELYRIDYDGYGPQRITKDRSINLLPRWSPESTELYYTTYRFGNPDLYSLNMVTGKLTPISQRQGLNSTCSFSPDGSKIVMTISRGQIPNLFLLKRSGEIIRQLTHGGDISTSPSFAPNGREIAYISDSPGYPQLFLMNLEGENVRRLPASGMCDSPAWSPRGDKIVFTMRKGMGDNKYDLFLYDLTNAGISRLTQGTGNNENPSWSPDGRFIVFASTRSGHSELYVIAVDGTGLRKLTDLPGSSFTPDWSK